MLAVIFNRFISSWTWYGIRAAGWLAAILLVLVILMGIGQVTGFTYRYIEPIKAWAIHKAMAIALCVAIFVHVGLLLIDNFMRFSLAQILVPFLSRYTNGTKFLYLPLGWAGIGFGILAMYGIFIIVLSSLGWIETKKALWQKLHYLSYLVAGLIFFHALYAGTDVKSGWLRVVWIIVGTAILIGLITRLRRRGSIGD